MILLIFRQLFDLESSTYTYLLADKSSRDAILIDPVFEQVNRDIALIHELNLYLCLVADTHVHADHVTGSGLLRHRLHCEIAVSKQSGAMGGDIQFDDGDTLKFGSRFLKVLATPGHTNGCSTFVLDDESMAFTGDCLLIRGCGRTDFQQGSPEKMFDSVREKIFALPDECLLYPGHDYKGATVSSVGEEKLYNPRLGKGISLNDFSGYMNNLGLAHPNKIDVAVPANMKCGVMDNAVMDLEEQDWAPLTLTYAGFWEVQPLWLEEHMSGVQIIDVREPDEYEGILGHIPRSYLMPLGNLVESSASLDKSRPVVTVCRSGARSTQATVQLKKAGFSKVANLSGGMLRWRAERLPVQGLTE